MNQALRKNARKLTGPEPSVTVGHFVIVWIHGSFGDHASIVTTLELWASSLRNIKSRIGPLFTQDRVAASAGLLLEGLLRDKRRKTGWMQAEAGGIELFSRAWC
jgi:hypothetical protein